MSIPERKDFFRARAVNARSARNAKRPPGTVDTIRGTVDITHISSPTFTAGRLTVDGGAECIAFRAKGQIVAGDSVQFTGTWKDDPKFGVQLDVTSYQLTADELWADSQASSQALAHYLTTLHVAGIGPARAHRIADWAAQHGGLPGLMTARCVADGLVLTPAQSDALHTALVARSARNTIGVYLSQYGLTARQISALTERYGDGLVRVLQEDPYVIAREISGYGFKRIDEIALSTGVKKHATIRVRAALNEAVTLQYNEGHTISPVDMITAIASGLLCLDVEAWTDEWGNGSTVESVLYDYAHMDGSPLMLGTLSSRLSSGSGGVSIEHVGRSSAIATESAISNMVRRAAAHPTERRYTNIHRQQSSLSLSGAQHRAWATAITERLSVMTGSAGTGKTYTLRAVCDWFAFHGEAVVLAAPTGKAARRMEESTGRPAVTLHRLMGYNGRKFECAAIVEPNGKPPAFIALDECSMIDDILMDEFLKRVAWDKTQVLLIGDPNQLAPIGAGAPFSDIIASGRIAVVTLDQVHRQAGILRAVSDGVLRYGQMPPRWEKTSPTTDDLLNPAPVPALKSHAHWDSAPDWDMQYVGPEPESVYERLRALARLDPEMNFVVLSPYRKKTLGVQALNAFLQSLWQTANRGSIEPPDFSRSPRPKTGDRVINRRNNYDIGIMNGQLGVVEKMDADNGIMRVSWEGLDEAVDMPRDDWYDVDLAYALTVHQVQGSEFPHVVFICHRQHAYMLNRRIVYTAITRAKRRALVIGDPWALKTAPEKIDNAVRRTLLRRILDVRKT